MSPQWILVWIAAAGLIYKAGRMSRDIDNLGRKTRSIDEERMRDYLRGVAFEVEKAVPGELGAKLGKLIRRDRID